MPRQRTAGRGRGGKRARAVVGVVVPQRNIEKPTPALYQGRSYAETQLVDPDRRTSAHDDKVQRVRTYRPSAGGRKTGLGSPWDDRNKIEKPLLPLYVEMAKRAGQFNRQQQQQQQQQQLLLLLQATVSGPLCRLPPELQDEILRHLLLWPRFINLFKGWTLLYPQTRPCLDLAVLRTCRHLYERGVRILYGENYFVYEIRDPAETDMDAAELVRRGLYAGCTFPLDRHGHLARFVRICIDAGRVMVGGHNRTAFVEALRKLADVRRRDGEAEAAAHVQTLTIEIPALVGVAAAAAADDEHHSCYMPLKEADVPICAFFGKDSSAVETIKKLKPNFLRLRVPAELDFHGGGGGGGAMQQYFYGADIDLRGCFDDDDESPAAGVPDTRDDKYSYGGEIRRRRITKSRATIENLPSRLYCLATNPDSKLSRSLWKRMREDYTEEAPLSYQGDDEDAETCTGGDGEGAEEEGKGMQISNRIATHIKQEAGPLSRRRKQPPGHQRSDEPGERWRGASQPVGGGGGGDCPLGFTKEPNLNVTGVDKLQRQERTSLWMMRPHQREKTEKVERWMMASGQHAVSGRRGWSPETGGQDESLREYKRAESLEPESLSSSNADADATAYRYQGKHRHQIKNSIANQHHGYYLGYEKQVLDSRSSAGGALLSSRSRRRRACTPLRDPELSTFMNDLEELGRQKNILADLRTSRGPLKKGKGNLRASNAATSRRIRRIILQREKEEEEERRRRAGRG